MRDATNNNNNNNNDNKVMSNNDTTTRRPLSLVVIGAGMAGMKLAHECLEKNPVSSITILEANSYVGGRMRSFAFEGYTVEAGANWVSGLDSVYDNPVWKLAQSVGLKGHFTDRNVESKIHAVDERGNVITQEYMDSMKRFNRVYDRAVADCAQRGLCPQNDASVRSVLKEFGWKQEELSLVDRAVEHNVLQVWVADGLENLSAAHDLREGANDVDLGKEEMFVEDARGFNCILNGMTRDVEKRGGVIKLNTVVQKVRYSPGNVVVTAQDVASGNIIEYKADAVVSTVSLGVLQKGLIEFSPPFPDWKTRAINELGMFVFAKVYVKFKDAASWTDKEQIVICREKTGHYPLWMKYRSSDQNLFMCYLGGKEAERVESLTLEEIKDEVEEQFQSAFENTNAEKPGSFRPCAVAVTNWSRSPRFCGSYSFFPTHAFSEIPETDLTRGLSGTNDKEDATTLYFAGECFDDKFNGWVQGAYRSGERVAKSILGI